MNNIVLTQLCTKTEELNVKDTKLKQKLTLLLESTCLQRLEKDRYSFLRYFPSKRKGNIFILIISGDSMDGLYEFEIFGHNLKFIEKRNLMGEVLNIETNSNYSLANFDLKDVNTIITRENDFQFSEDLNSFLIKVLNFDVVTVNCSNNKKTVFNQSLLGEIQFKKQLKSFVRDNYADISKIIGLEKRKKLSINRLNLGEEEFKRQIISLNLITDEEYTLFTSLDDEKFNKYRKENHCLLVEVL